MPRACSRPQADALNIPPVPYNDVESFARIAFVEQKLASRISYGTAASGQRTATRTERRQGGCVGTYGALCDHCSATAIESASG